MRIRLGGLTLVLALLSAGAGASSAQTPRGGPFLLRRQEFRAELKFTVAQNEKVEAVLNAAGKAYLTGLTAARKLPTDQDAARRRSLLSETTESIKKALDFSPEQARRFDQIMLQRRRFDAFRDTEVTRKLKLHAAQRAEIAEMAAQRGKKLSAIQRESGKDRMTAQKRAAELERELAKRVIEGFDPEQRAVWKELTGKPFELPAEAEVRRPD